MLSTGREALDELRRILTLFRAPLGDFGDLGDLVDPGADPGASESEPRTRRRARANSRNWPHG